MVRIGSLRRRGKYFWEIFCHRILFCIRVYRGSKISVCYTFKTSILWYNKEFSESDMVSLSSELVTFIMSFYCTIFYTIFTFGFTIFRSFSCVIYMNAQEKILRIKSFVKKRFWHKPQSLFMNPFYSTVVFLVVSINNL